MTWRILLLAPFLLAPALAAAQDLPTTNPDPVLHAGDAVRITVWRNEELSGEFDIAEDGTIRHPLYRGVHVAGLTADSAEVKIGRFLSRYESSPSFVIEPLFRVAVGGEVRLPNLYPLTPETTLGEAVAKAGGATDQGRMDRVILFRDGQQFKIDLTKPEAGVAALKVRSGDQIIVSRRRNWLRDYFAPVASILGATAMIINYATR